MAQAARDRDWRASDEVGPKRLPGTSSPYETQPPRGGEKGRLTARDLEIVRWVGRIGAATVDHVMARFGLSRSIAYDRVAVCSTGRLLRRTKVLHGEPALL